MFDGVDAGFGDGGFEILDALWVAIEAFAQGGPQADDMTALALCRGEMTE